MIKKHAGGDGKLMIWPNNYTLFGVYFNISLYHNTYIHNLGSINTTMYYVRTCILFTLFGISLRGTYVHIIIHIWGLLIFFFHVHIYISLFGSINISIPCTYVATYI